MAHFPVHTALLVKSTALTEFTKHLVFEVKGVPHFGFVAGQWVSAKEHKPDGEEITRAYSIASPPNGSSQFALCLNRVQDGFMSNLLCDLEPGAEVPFQGPFGSRSETDIYYHSEFLKLAKEHANFHYLPTLSRGSANWTGLRGYVQEHVPGIVGTRADMHAYICGLKKMITANRELLKGRGWDRKSIIYEAYD